jgi:murein DD-endopeptidase MepM/ murein hydrolase activator NlpD
MKNTLSLAVLLFACIKSTGQFNTIDKFGTKSSLNTDSVPKIDTTGNKLNEDQTNFEKKTNQLEKITFPILTLPLKAIKRTSGFGSRIHPILMSYKTHSGIDLKAFYEPVYSVAAGVVIQSGFRPVEGNFVKIKHGTIESIYCHLSKLFVGIGDKVEAGAQIGISGNTGRSTGPHLHFGLKYNGRFVDPELFLRLFNSE